MDKDSKQYTKDIINRALEALWDITNTAEASESASEEVTDNYDNFNSALDDAVSSLEETYEYADYLQFCC